MSDRHTKGLFKENMPLFEMVYDLDNCLKNAIREMTEDEYRSRRLEIEDIRAMISFATKTQHLHGCKNRISDMLLRLLAERRNVKNTIFSL